MSNIPSEHIQIRIERDMGRQWRIEVEADSTVLFKAECWSYDMVLQLLRSVSGRLLTP